jgi:hypothetical protein
MCCVFMAVVLFESCGPRERAICRIMVSRAKFQVNCRMRQIRDGSVSRKEEKHYVTSDAESKGKPLVITCTNCFSI